MIAAAPKPDNMFTASQLITLVDEYVASGRVSSETVIKRFMEQARELYVPYMSEEVVVRESTQGGFGLFSQGFIPSGALLLVEHPHASLPDVVLAKSRFAGQDGGDTLALATYIGENWSKSMEMCLRGLYPIRTGCIDTGAAGTRYDAVLMEKLTRILPPDMNPASVIRAVELNCIGFYTFPELVSYDQHLRYLSGTGLYEKVSMLNHSCSPNIVHYSIGDVMLLRAAVDIEPNEELFISYIGTDILRETKSIRDEFLSGRDFVCKCKKCQTPDASDPWLEELDTATRAQLRSRAQDKSLVSFIDTLLSDRDYILRDRIQLMFLRCRLSRKEDDQQWDELVSMLDPTDFTLAVVHLHFGSIFGFTEESKLSIQAVSERCFGLGLGSFDMIMRLLLTTDFR